jgi:hypothetical protein
MPFLNWFVLTVSATAGQYSVVEAAIRRTARAVRLAARDDQIPRPLRWLVGLGLLPIPGPVDELILLAAAVPLALFYRHRLRDAWRRAGAG